MYTRTQFNYEKMRDRLDEILTPLVESVPQQVELKLPKLKKVKS